jgi:hypothetical protein
VIANIRQFLEAGPFSPFFIVTRSGNRYRVASADHASINPRGSQIVVWFDDESSVIVAGLHVSALEKESPEKAQAA